LMSKIKKNMKKIILIYFHAKIIFKKHFTPQYQIDTQCKVLP
jgi:hypothetical protein